MSGATDIYSIHTMSKEDAEDALFQLVNVVRYFGAEDNDVKSDIARILSNYGNFRQGRADQNG